MAYTIRNLITDAYAESGVVGIGMTVQAHQLAEGLTSLNLILDEVYAGNDAQATVAASVAFDGRSNYTVGPQPANPLLEPDLVPDIELPVMPSAIDEIVVTIGGVRIITKRIDPVVYHRRSLDSISNNAPSVFAFERTNPLGTIRFYEGTPTGPGEIIYKPSMVDVTANTDYKYHPRELRPYLVYALAAKLANLNAFDANDIQIRANNAWNRYKSSTYEGQHYMCDDSAPTGESGGKYNIYRGM